MQDLATTDEGELVSALRLLLMEYCVRHAVTHLELHERMAAIVAPDRMEWPVELKQHPYSHALLEYLTQTGFAWCVLSGRLDRTHRAHNVNEYELLARSGVEVRGVRRLHEVSE